jgi:solute:Na+ symporter, SSS family
MTSVLRLNLGWLDYLLVAIYFVFVLGIGFIARSQISTSLDFSRRYWRSSRR